MKPKFKNLHYITIISIGILISIYGFISSEFFNNFENINFIYIGLRISEFSGFLMLLFNGTFIKTKYSRILRAIISVIIIGVLAKISHWNYSNIILISGFVGVIIIYFLSFLKKPIRNRLDYLKLFWVIVVYSGSILNYLHQISSDYQILSSSLMWLAIIDYLKREKEKGKLFD